ncbi:hypothetical protein EG68_02142 [Paragonimus skrjabini miyazakii]|uniref:Uncharacterized protein n=1 Tax=Paragonimus skrjabini miyazakii TaxID=59628 RepID=A0A8S9Z3D9_9TREM|nr:hypothetical protein EG68_02142 [Paragonimus skrjabini miyazakii]
MTSLSLFLMTLSLVALLKVHCHDEDSQLMEHAHNVYYKTTEPEHKCIAGCVHCYKTNGARLVQCANSVCREPEAIRFPRNIDDVCPVLEAYEGLL